MHTDTDRSHEREHSAPGWNWAHILWLAALPFYALFAASAGWSAFAMLAVHLGLTLAWFGFIERRWPHRPEWAATAPALRRDGIFFGANLVADSVAGVAVSLLAMELSSGGVASALPAWVGVPVAVMVAEFGAYWLHRAMHQGGWLWRVHAVHHRPEELHVSNNFTTHPLNVLMLKPVKLLPLAALGFSAETILWASLFMQMQSFATHANTRGGMGWLNYVIGTAELHRRHHGTQVEEALNFSTAIPLWDQLFCTFRYRATEEPRKVGVASPENYPAPTDTAGLLAMPLLSPRSGSPAAGSHRCADGP